MVQSAQQKCRKNQNKNAEKARTKNAEKARIFLENIVIRDLLVYAQAHDARILHYTDDTGLEADAVYQMAEGRYAPISYTTENGVKVVPVGVMRD